MTAITHDIKQLKIKDITMIKQAYINNIMSELSNGHSYCDYFFGVSHYQEVGTAVDHIYLPCHQSESEEVQEAVDSSFEQTYYHNEDEDFELHLDRALNKYNWAKLLDEDGELKDD